MAKVTVDNLSAAIEDVLKEYGEQVGNLCEDAVKEVTKLGVKAVKSSSKVFGGNGNYASGWTSQVETGRMSAQGTIYNRKVPGLPHLLEHGHLLRNGKRKSGTVHIAPVQEELEKTFRQELERSL